MFAEYSLISKPPYALLWRVAMTLCVLESLGTKIIIHSIIMPPPPPPPPPNSRDHRKLFVGDALGRIFSWTVSDNLGKCMEDKGQRCSLYCLGWGECVMISSFPPLI